MQFSNYSDFRTKLLKLIDGDNVGSQSIEQATLDLLAALGEQRVYRELRATTMLTDLSATVTDNAADLPADLIELKEVWFDGERPLEVVRLDLLRTLEAASRTTGTGSRYVAQDGDTLRFWPIADGTLLGRYYRRPGALSAWSDTTTVDRYPDLFIYGALAESAPFLGEDQRIPMWEGLYNGWLKAAQANERMRVWGAGPLRIRAR